MEQIQSMNMNDVEIAVSGQIPEIQKLTDGYEKLVAENAKMQTTIASLRVDIEKLKGQLGEKVQKAVLSELEGKINTHTKALDANQRKLFEVQNSLNTFVQQPISHTLVENIRKQLTEEIMTNVKALVEPMFDNVRKLIDDKNVETRSMINKAKTFMFHK